MHARAQARHWRELTELMTADDSEDMERVCARATRNAWG